MILQLNNEKTIGFVCTPVSVLSDPFSHIIDLFSKQALHPECLKIAQVTPAHKQNDTHFCSYYRLKSLLLQYSVNYLKKLCTNRVCSYDL